MKKWSPDWLHYWSLGRAVLRFLALLLLGLSGCGTPYQPMQGGSGFADEQIAPDKFVISFQGNGHDTSEKVSDLALLHAAEVTLAHGLGYFAVLDVTNTSSAREYTQRQQFYTDYPPSMGLPPPSVGGYDPYRFGYIVQYEDPRIYFRPGTRLVAQGFKSRPDKPFTYDAAALEQELRRKYNLKAALMPPQRFGAGRGKVNAGV
jgi:hypothetical protein